MVAENALHSTGRVVVKAPEWLSEDARRVFERTKRQLRNLGLLESCDVDLLALYSDAVARYREAAQAIDPGDPKTAQAAQSWSRLVLSYAEKMGISATGRARLARKNAEQEAPIDDMEVLLNDVTEFVNGGQ